MNISKAIWQMKGLPSCFPSGWGELVTRIELNMAFCTSCVLMLINAYALVDLWFWLGLIGSRLGRMIFHKMSPRTHHLTICNKITEAISTSAVGPSVISSFIFVMFRLMLPTFCLLSTRIMRSKISTPRRESDSIMESLWVCCLHTCLLLVRTMWNFSRKWSVILVRFW